MDLGTKVPRRSGWKPWAAGTIALGLFGVGLISFQSSRSEGSSLRYNVQDSSYATGEYFCGVCHGHDQDLYRDFIVNQWKGFYIVNKFKGYPGIEEYMSYPAEALPHEFGLYDDCPNGDQNWARIAGISYMSLDFNKDMRNDQKGWYQKNQEHSRILTAEEHFDKIKATWSQTYAQPYLRNMRFIKELLRYQDDPSRTQNSGFVAYVPGVKGSNAGKEVLVVVEGSMGSEDGKHNFRGWGTNFGESVLQPLGITLRHAPKALRMHSGYAQIVVELYKQIREAIKTVRKKYGEIQNVTVTGHSLGAAVGAGLLKVLEEDPEFEAGANGILFAQPNAFKMPFFSDFFTHFWKTQLSDEARMGTKVINVRNTYDPVVMGSMTSWYVPIGTPLDFTAKMAAPDHVD